MEKLPNVSTGDGWQCAGDRPLGLGKLFGWDIGLTAGMLAGSMTSTPVLVGAGDTASFRHGKQAAHWHWII